MSNKKLTAAEWFAEFGKKLEEDGSLQVDAAKFELSEQIFQAMEDKRVSEAELSRRLGVSRAYVNKILQGDTNFTIETLVKIGIALGAEFKFEFRFESNGKEEVSVLDADRTRYLHAILPTIELASIKKRAKSDLKKKAAKATKRERKTA